MSINIAKSNVAGNCNTKCAYSFDYKECGLNAINVGSLIAYGIDPAPSVPPVLYNNNQYMPAQIVIVYPSIHKYDGYKANAELHVRHYPVNGGNDLAVVIPIVLSPNTSDASILISQMITDVAAKAPKAGNNISRVSGIDNFSLNTIVPKAPFYSYSKDGKDFIVFGAGNSIPIPASILENKLKKITTPFPSQPDDTSTKVFYNASGSKSTLADQGIYIDCQPTGSSGEVEVVQAKNPPIYDLDTIMKDPTVFMILQLLMSCLIFIVIYFFISYGFAFITGTNPGLKKAA
jgi:hypothetical protein